MTWIVSVRYWSPTDGNMSRHAVVGPARASTVEAVLHLAAVPEDIRAEIRGNAVVRDFVDGKLDPDKPGYYVPSPLPANHSWLICIGSVHEVLDR